MAMFTGKIMSMGKNQITASSLRIQFHFKTLFCLSVSSSVFLYILCQTVEMQFSSVIDQNQVCGSFKKNSINTLFKTSSYRDCTPGFFSLKQKTIRCRKSFLTLPALERRRALLQFLQGCFFHADHLSSFLGLY